jgi:dihydroneopterin aldolase
VVTAIVGVLPHERTIAQPLQIDIGLTALDRIDHGPSRVAQS